MTPYFIYDNNYTGVNASEIEAFGLYKDTSYSEDGKSIIIKDKTMVSLKNGKDSILDFTPKEFCEVLNMTK